MPKFSVLYKVKINCYNVKNFVLYSIKIDCFIVKVGMIYKAGEPCVCDSRRNEESAKACEKESV